MKKDILRPKVEDVAMAVVRLGDANDDDWAVYLINRKQVPLRNVLISSKGYGTLNGEEVRTSVLRHFFDEVKPNSFVKIEKITFEVFGLNNEYLLSFYIDGDIYDRKYIFLPESITTPNLVKVPLVNLPGVLIA